MYIWLHFRKGNLNGKIWVFSFKNTNIDIYEVFFSDHVSGLDNKNSVSRAVIDAYSHSGVDFSFFRCGHKSELDFINQPVNSVSFAFKS